MIQLTKILLILQVGTALVGAGELRLDTDGTLSLQPPSNGSEYFLSLVDFDSLQGDLRHTAFWCRVLAIASALVGAAVVLWVGRRYYCQLKVRWRQKRDRREFERLMAKTLQASVLGPKASDDRDEHVENSCVICCTQPRNCILMDCGHVCCCHSCYQAFPHQRCPICRQDIIRVLPLHYV